MVESSKILTVSYGTFSCTLEGFDDAFDTMKAIAEYFRDLAADDRYFGAEPPTPDAEMLARLAERNSARRVTARTEEGNIVLSPDRSPAPDQAAGKALVQTAADAAPELEAPHETAVAASSPAPLQQDFPEQDDGPLQSSGPEDGTLFDEDLSEEELPSRPLRAPRIAAALAAAADAALLASQAPPTRREARPSAEMAPAGQTEDPDDTVLSEAWPEAPELDASPEGGLPAETMPPALAETEETSAAGVALVEETPAETPVGTVAAEAEPAPTLSAPLSAVSDLPETDDAQAPDTPAAALPSEERAISPADAELTGPADPVAEPLPEDDLTPSGEGWDSIAEAEEAIAIARAEAEEGEELPVASPAPTDVALKLQRIRDVVARRRDAIRVAAAAAEPSATDAPIAEEPAAQIQPEDTSGAPGSEQESAAPELAAEDVPQVSDTLPDAEAGLTSDDATFVDLDAEAAPDFAAAADPEAATEAASSRGGATARPMARIIKVKRREAAESSLSPEQEDELQRELAAIEAEARPAAEIASQTAYDAEGQTLRAGLGARSLRDTDHGAQMDRILRETDNQFEQADSTRRRSALAHLRAAVAAKKAEKEAGSDFTPREDTTDAYREDLAQVVRPRRPAIAHQSSEPARRSTTARPAPLKLVAEQRIDVSGSARGPVRPRRVSIADLARREEVAPPPSGAAAATPGGQEESFADYARAVGARSLGELLEAAASYMSFIERQPLFSRPQLMSRVKSLHPEGFSREDGLRAFGQLLREGKIRKADAGRFSVSDSIGFRPEERAAG
ncbi:hypothetical protein [Oceanicola sp. S124]|uniref:hypothetical protein n=1 Tax=Oceanicola sp. S124 TaxID=1042378 RepID=UPI0002FCA129|nr:hypothetical protein [Oceanicola sp. S124]